MSFYINRTMLSFSECEENQQWTSLVWLCPQQDACQSSSAFSNLWRGYSTVLHAGVLQDIMNWLAITKRKPNQNNRQKKNMASSKAEYRTSVVGFRYIAGLRPRCAGSCWGRCPCVDIWRCLFLSRCSVTRPARSAQCLRDRSTDIGCGGAE